MPDSKEQILEKKLAYDRETLQLLERMRAEFGRVVLPPLPQINEPQACCKHLLEENNGWEPPSPELVHMYFSHFKQHFPKYGSNEALAKLLGIRKRNLRKMTDLDNPRVIYDVWRRFLILCGRVEI